MELEEAKEQLRKIAYPIGSEYDAFAVVRVLERLKNSGNLTLEAAQTLRAVFDYEPEQPSDGWALRLTRAARLLGPYPDELERVAFRAQHLTALGALLLSEAGRHDAVIDSWLVRTDEYDLLESEERTRLSPILRERGLDDALAKLAGAHAGAPEWTMVMPQRYRHRDGAEVFSVDRFTVGYRDRDREVHVTVERGSGISVYTSSARVVAGSEPPDGGWERILNRIAGGLAAMGYELVDMA